MNGFAALLQNEEYMVLKLPVIVSEAYHSLIILPASDLFAK